MDSSAATEAASLTVPTLVAIVGAVGIAVGSGITAAGILLQQRLANEQSRRGWEREDATQERRSAEDSRRRLWDLRHQAYARLLEQGARAEARAMLADPGAPFDELRELTAAVAEVSLLGPRPVLVQANLYHQAITDLYDSRNRTEGIIHESANAAMADANIDLVERMGSALGIPPDPESHQSDSEGDS